MKKIVAFLALIYLCMFVGGAAQAEPSYLTIENATQKEDVLSVVLHSDLLKSATPEQLTLTCDGEPLSNLHLTKLNESGTPSSLLFLVDNSASVREKTLAQMTTIVQQMCKQMRTNDNAALLTLDDGAAAAWTQSAQELNAALASINRLKDNPSLYQAIQNAIVTLQTAVQANESRCLVILSDGVDTSSTGVAIDELYTLAAQVNYPIYVVSFVQDSNEAAQTRAARSLGGIARACASGMEVTLGLDKQTPESVTLSLLAQRTDAYVLTAILPQMLLTPATRTCTASFSDGQSIYQVSKDYESLALTTPVPTNTQEPLPTVTVQPIPPVPAFPWWLAVCLGVVIALGIIGIVVSQRVQAKRKANDKQEKTIPTTGIIEAKDEDALDKESNAPVDNTAILNDSPVIDLYQQQPDYRLYLAEIGGDQDDVYTADLAQRVVIGRDTEQCEVLLKGDKMVSSRHCCIEAREGDLYLFDLGSTNGTQLNGVPVATAVKLQQDDVIRVGRTALRIRWQMPGKE